ncbi:MAG: hypothetical protein CMB83_04550 [Flammeovirgaceae bacterium]|nr:hypothetical protein [Flammeovirgaceae bacterium]|tara:strand:- start:1229 stop:1696 length:468 start_codon:yes stop_codon:yes gene_type:complete
MQTFYLYILLLVHPLYISTSEIFLKENKHDIKIKIFRDDLEDDLRLFFDKSISIDTEIKLKNVSSQLDAYIKDKFQISVNKSEIIPSIDNYNLVNDLIVINLSFEKKGNIYNIKVSNNVLFDVFQVQKNVVLINFENQIQSHILSFSDREKTFTY